MLEPGAQEVTPCDENERRSVQGGAMTDKSSPTDSTPTLLVLTSTYPRWPGDPEPGFVHELSSRLADGFRVIVLCPHAAGAKSRESTDGVEVVRYRYAAEWMETLVNDGGIITNLRRSRWKLFLVPGFVLAQAWYAWRILRREKIDVVHAHWIIPQGLVALVLKLLRSAPPFVVTSHGADLFALRGALLGRVKRAVLRHASQITVVSEAMRRTLKSTIDGNGDALVMPMGVDLRNRFKLHAEPPRELDQILFVGRLVEKKGVRYLLDAMPAVLARRPNASLVIAGFGPEKEALEQQVARLGLNDHVTFLGAVPQADLPQMYQRAALLVAPFVEAGSGDQEGLGLVLVEAVGCGCPILAGDVPAVRDVLGTLPGRMVDPRCKDALATAILENLEDPGEARRQTLELRESLVRRFDWENVSARYSAVLRDLAGGGLAD